jgi:hypothetical protein
LNSRHSSFFCLFVFNPVFGTAKVRTYFLIFNRLLKKVAGLGCIG